MADGVERARRPVVVHFSRVTKGGFFGPDSVTTGSLCGRNRTTADGMNLGRKSEVTCKFCLRAMETWASEIVAEAEGSPHV